MDLSIVIVNYNTPELTIQVVNSVLTNTKGIRFEIILVDNASKDKSLSTFKKHFAKEKKVDIVASKINLGFAGGNNLGISKSNGKYILLLNSDTLVKSDVIKEMVAWMDSHKNVGISTCKLLNEDGSLQPTGGYFPTLSRVFAWMFFVDDIPLVNNLFKSFHPHVQHYQASHKQDWITGAFFLMRREVVQDVGMFDEKYFMYVEEVDLCYRAKDKWEVWYLPKWSIVHLGGASSGGEFSTVSEMKNIIYFFSKHYPSWQMPILKLILKTGMFLRMPLMGIIKDRKYFGIYAKAFRSI